MIIINCNKCEVLIFFFTFIGHQMQRSTTSMHLALLLTVLSQKHSVVSFERHPFCIALHSVQISHFQDHIKQNNDQLFPEVLFTSRLNAFLFSIYFLFKSKQGANACFIYNVSYLFLSVFQSYFPSISFMYILIINETLYGK